ncbi:hypothetical protein [Hyphomicrobium sp. CS1GBMeth3]|uniref:hypothetical protein n=1 Tax=Hyphomicrobium sp. CS1GBMeth3 TaxID=1892845 RepID=UPI000930C322|nr:hypothetical protein [Hyphomicrobium sp. CS1GBMeth3]
MNSSKVQSTAIALSAIVLSIGGPAAAGPVTTANGASVSHQAQSNVQHVRHGRWGGVGIYIGPSYDYDYGYAYRPRYRSYYYDDYYYDDGYDYRPYRHYNRRWVRKRFEHPLGRR